MTKKEEQEFKKSKFYPHEADGMALGMAIMAGAAVLLICAFAAAIYFFYK